MFEAEGWQIAFPDILKICAKITLDPFLVADIEAAAEDAKGMEEGSELASGLVRPTAPRTLIHAGEQREEVAAEQVFRILVHVEPGANV